MKYVQDSTSRKIEMITQYISHGAICVRSDVRMALYEANIGKRIDMTELDSAKDS